MDLINYIVNEVKHQRIGKAAALDLIRQYRRDGTGHLHPLLHSNTSDLSEQRFSTRLTGGEFFLAHHRLGGRRVLPGVAYLEMARAALARSWGENKDALCLRNVVWSRPLFIEQAQELHIGLHPQADGGVGFRIYTYDAQHNLVQHSQGEALFSRDEAAPVLDVSDLRGQCDGAILSAQDIYGRFTALGLDYGPAHRAIETLHLGQGQALARLRLPPEAQGGAQQYVLHPSMLDAALQAAGAVLGGEVGPSMPFAVREVDIWAACTEHMWAWVQLETGKEAANAVPTCKILLCDEQGAVCVRIAGFATRPVPTVAAQPEALSLLLPVWDTVQPARRAESDGQGVRALVVGATEPQRAALTGQFDGLWHESGGAVCSVSEWTRILTEHGPFDRLIWIADAGPQTVDQAQIAAQQEGVLSCFRLIKALLEQGYAQRALEWTVLTTQTQAVHAADRVAPAHAGLHGLAGAMIKEHPRWRLSLLDMPMEQSWPLQDALDLPGDSSGRSLAWRDGHWYEQQCLPVQIEGDAPVPYRRGAVYVLIGGAGGIGQVWSEFVIRHYAAQVVWVGRRPLDATIQADIDALADLGPAPLYISADASRLDDLSGALAQVAQRYGAVHGVVHSALVLGDRSLARMSEAAFVDSLRAKVDVSVCLAQVLEQMALLDSLDFVVFFSSLQSFSRAAGQSNYAAACTFKDMFAHRLAQSWPCRVRIINWGWWGEVGVVASEDYRERMRQQGVLSIQSQEGMEALSVLLSGRARQLGLLKLSRPLAQAQPDGMCVLEPTYTPIAASLSSPTGRVPAIQGNGFEAEFSALSRRLLCGQLQALGLAVDQTWTLTQLLEQLGVHEKYARWLEQSLRELADQAWLRFDGQTVSTQGMPAIDLAAAWAQWEQSQTQWLATPAFKAQVLLAQATLQRLPDILTGRLPATDVLFPGSSMQLLEGVYKHNPVADYFNTVLVDLAQAFVQSRIGQDAQAQIRILEIGAGTGGTSAMMFERLIPYAAHVADYCYTDVSKAFLFHAEKEYGPSAPYLSYRLLDISQPLAQQDIPIGHFDMVIATNVLHATPDIARSLRHAKAALRPNGVLLLNEISRAHIFTHITFGLLDGWWLYQDGPIRIPGCPGLSPQAWSRVLKDEGFDFVGHPVADKAALGQQIIVAQSDGVVRLPAVQAQIVPPRTALPQTRQEPPPIQAPVQRREQAQALPDTLHQRTTAYLMGLLAKTLKLPANKIRSNEALEKYGIDSILVVEMTTALQEVLSDVSSTLFFEYRTLDELAAHFVRTQPAALEKIVQAPAPGRPAAAPEAALPKAPSGTGGARTAGRFAGSASGPVSPPVQAESAVAQQEGVVRARQDIAIIGLSGRYAQAANVEQFWENLSQGRNCITEIPPERWDHEQYFDPQRGKAGKAYSKWGSFIDGVDQFDPLFFNISPREAQFMDPQERLFLEQAYASIEDAGYTPAALAAQGRVGVFAGVMNALYGNGARYWSVANRVSYLFDFSGPSLAVDTACSSSLTALHLALESLQAGSSELALVGGVNLILDPMHYLTLSAMNMLSQGDCCRAFGDQADGFVDGEGVGVIVLKPLSRAVADGDQIYGVLKASAINHGGKTNGYTVPNPHAQADAIARCLQEADIDPRSISYLEAHGTGTALGDPIEIAGLGKAFSARTADKQFCAIGSVKSNIGHCESAAGIAGITKVLLQLKHGKLAPSLNADVLNPAIDFAATPFVVQRELGDWLRPVIEVDGRRQELPRRAGISSFGAGGSNAHVIVQEYRGEPGAKSGALRPVSIVLSARNADRLRERARQLLTAVEHWGWQEEQLGNLAFTLQVGREAMQERLAFQVDSLEQLQSGLRAYVDGHSCSLDLYSGNVKDGRDLFAAFAADEDVQELLHKWRSQGKHGKILELWAKGVDVDWSSLYEGQRPQRMSLPTYPFARERYWAASPGTDTEPAHEPSAQPGMRQESDAALHVLEPVWRVQSPAALAAGTGNVLLIGGTVLQQDMVRAVCGSVQLADFSAQSSVADIADALAAGEDVDHVVWIVPDEVGQTVGDAMIAAQQQGVLFGFRLIKALLQSGYDARALSWSVLTTQTQKVGSEAVLPAHAGVHGLMGTLAKEYVNWSLRLVDLPVEGAWPWSQVLTLPSDAQGNSWAWRAGQWYRQHLLPQPVAQVHGSPYRRGGVYVVIGGAGGLGRAWTEHLMRDYDAQIVWMGRRALDGTIQQAIDELAGCGPAPVYLSVDASNREALQQAYGQIKQRFGTVHGVIHSALVLGDQSLAAMEESRFHASLQAKVDISVRLAQVFDEQDLDFVLFFSSMQSQVRGAGQSNYAAGCLFKDAFAQALAQRWSCPVRVMNWGWWGSVGVAATPEYGQRMRRQGLESIEPQQAWPALARLLCGEQVQLALLKTSQAGEVAARAQDMQAASLAPRVPAVAQLEPADDGGEAFSLRARAVMALKAVLGDVLHLAVEQIDESESLAIYGVDSISVTQLAGTLGRYFPGVTQTLFYDHQTIAALADYLLATQRDSLQAWVAPFGDPPDARVGVLPTAKVPQVQQARRADIAPVPSQTVPDAVLTQTGSTDIAIVGMAAQFPGVASVQAYWQWLQAGRKADNQGPVRRWPEQAQQAQMMQQPLWGAFLDDVDSFDPAFFGISPLMAELIDPQERLFLMTCWHALEDAGYGNDRRLARCDTDEQGIAVYVGVTAASYNLVGFERTLQGDPQLTSLSFASIANRVSHALGLSGPSMAVDTMCSSSLVAVHMACESLRSGQCSMALAGGVNLNLHPSRLTAMAQGKLLSRDGESRSFCAGGQGFVAGEGVGAVVLKPLRAAQRDGDVIHAVIKGSAVGHGGSTLTYFAPSSKGQSKAAAAALRVAQVSPHQISYIEMQGIGDESVDAAEVQALRQAYQTGQRATGPLRLGSVKPNIGHAEAAAGMAQLIKVVLQLQHGVLVQTLVGHERSPQLDFTDGTMSVQEHPYTLPVHDQPALMGVNAFGAGGTAAHLIMQAYSDKPVDDVSEAEHLLVVSAGSASALRRAAQALADWLQSGPAQFVSLARIAHTLQCRKDAAHRLTVQAATVGEAALKLQQWLSQGAAAAVLHGFVLGRANGIADAAVLRTWFEQKNWLALGQQWVAGMSIDWLSLTGESRLQQVSLPGYAFDLRAYFPQHPVGAQPEPALPQSERVELPAQVGEISMEAENTPQAGLLQSITDPAAALAYLHEQVRGVGEYVEMITIGVLYAMLQQHGALIREARDEAGRLALYVAPPGDGPAAERLLLRFLSPDGTLRHDAPEMSGGVATRLLGRFAWWSKTAQAIGRRVPGAAGVPVAYLLHRLVQQSLADRTDHGVRLRLPLSIERRAQLDALQGEQEIGLRALPEYAPYCQLLTGVLHAVLTGQRPDDEQLDTAYGWLADMFVLPSRLSFLNRLVADLCLETRFQSRERLAVLMVGAGGFEALSALRDTRAQLECTLVSGWPRLAQHWRKHGQARFQDISFSAFSPMASGALGEHLGQNRFDVVIINTQDPCTQELPSLLASWAQAACHPELVIMTAPIDRTGLPLILSLADLWPQVASARQLGDPQVLEVALLNSAYRKQTVLDPLVSVFSREADRMPEGQDVQVQPQLRDGLLDVFSAAVDSGVRLAPEQDLMQLGLSSIAWALVFAKLQACFGTQIRPELFEPSDATLTVDTLAQRLAQPALQDGQVSNAPLDALPDVRDRLAGRLVDAGQHVVECAAASQMHRREFVSSRGQLIEYYEYGSGPALIFLTALAFEKSIWEAQIRAFGGRCRVICPHLPGHAGSHYAGAGFTFEDLAGDIVELMDSLAIERAHLVGWCIAGNIAQLLALEHPERLASLALVCTTPTDARMRGVTQRALHEYSASPLLTYQLEFNTIYQEDFLTPAVLHSLAMIRQAHVPVQAQALLCFIGNLFEFDTRARLHEISVPTLIIAGRHDIAFPVDQVALLKEAIADARLLVLDKGGHLPFLNQSEQFNRALGDFLDSCRA
ncbi:MAG TPA: SDR family NAD(P)-dependent oxidoreductase [Alcaligenes sp.]|nr:SDR family NAD(P)-dependent oxidoreductase [Alcaligenes sp.]HRL27146.1 SDR family NAD(P)-dependent oxidoreductase [Alcaligenes sp.]